MTQFFVHVSNSFYKNRYTYIYLHYGIEDFLALLFKPPLLTKNYRYLQSMFLTYDKWCSILQWYLHYIILLFVRKKTFQGIVIKLWRKNESIKIISHDCSNRYTIQLMFGIVCPMIGDFLIRCFREIILFLSSKEISLVHKNRDNVKSISGYGFCSSFDR